MILRAKPQMVSFHFGLPKQEVVDTIKGAGIFVISSATTVHSLAEETTRRLRAMNP